MEEAAKESSKVCVVFLGASESNAKAMRKQCESM